MKDTWKNSRSSLAPGGGKMRDTGNEVDLMAGHLRSQLYWVKELMSPASQEAYHKIWIKSQEEINLGVTQTSFDPWDTTLKQN